MIITLQESWKVLFHIHTRRKQPSNDHVSGLHLYSNARVVYILIYIYLYCIYSQLHLFFSTVSSFKGVYHWLTLANFGWKVKVKKELRDLDLSYQGCPAPCPHLCGFVGDLVGDSLVVNVL